MTTAKDFPIREYSATAPENSATTQQRYLVGSFRLRVTIDTFKIQLFHEVQGSPVVALQTRLKNEIRQKLVPYLSS